MNIVLLENIHPEAKSKLESEGFNIQTQSGALGQSELIECLKQADAVGIRSKTQLNSEILKCCTNLKVIGTYCIGTNQVDLNSANTMGIPVFNAPYSNTRSVAELVIAEIIALSRRLGDINSAAHRGEWLKSADGNHEVRGKTLGIVGYGHIGSQVSVLAEAIGLKVIYYDTVKKLPLGNATPTGSLDDLLRNSDFVTLHVPATVETQNMLNLRKLKKMKPRSMLINASRGSVVVIEDLKQALESGQLGGAAVDVFPTEPKNNKEQFSSELRNLPNVILTPHIGGSTEEAQFNIGQEVSESIVKYLKNGSTSGAVNFPQVDLPVHEGASRLLNVHKNEPGVLGEINSIVSEMGVNIEAQYLSTDSSIGYLVMDVSHPDMKELRKRVAGLSRSIKTRIV